MNNLPARVGVACLLACFGATACYEAPTRGPDGDLRMGVVGQDNQGNFYRLRDAIFDITGTGVASVSTESEPDPVIAFLVDLPAGPYSVELADGWRLERWDPDTDDALDVEATLTSPNPEVTLVTASEVSQVTFEFDVPNAGPVAMGDGELIIDIDIDVLQECDVVTQDCPDGDGCYAIATAEGIDTTCLPPVDSLGVYAPCSATNACLPGLMCGETFLNSACDDAEVGCCIEFCSLTAPSCAAGETCSPMGAALPDAGRCLNL